jgi:hypothetical protein
MTTIPAEITGKASGDLVRLRSGLIEPLAVTFKVGAKLTGVGQTTLWKLGKEKRIQLIRPPNTRRTLIYYPSLKRLFLPEQADVPRPRRRGRPRKHAVSGPGNAI